MAHTLFDKEILAQRIKTEIEKKLVFSRVLKEQVLKGEGLNLRIRIVNNSMMESQELEAYEAIPKTFYGEDFAMITIKRRGLGVVISQEELESADADVAENIVSQISEVIARDLEKDFVRVINISTAVEKIQYSGVLSIQDILLAQTKFADEMNVGSTFLLINHVDYGQFLANGATVERTTFREGDSIKVVQHVNGVEIIVSSFVTEDRPVMLKNESVTRAYKNSKDVIVTEDKDNDNDTIVINGRVWASHAVTRPNHVFQFEVPVVVTP